MSKAIRFREPAEGRGSFFGSLIARAVFAVAALLLFLSVSYLPAYGQLNCKLAPRDPVGTITLRPGGSAVDLAVRLSNTGSDGFFLDRVEIQAPGGGRDGCPVCLNDGYLVTTSYAVSGEFVPVAGFYEFVLNFDPAGVPGIATGLRCGEVVAHVSNPFIPPPGNVSMCSFSICADVRTPAGDLNCDAQLSPADVVIELNAVFLGTPISCL